ncbi:GNAT family N-acetyltransferase [Saccharopolyspora sp. HNM0983]|uniref:GNAT family N-acetyltransferase n=1 Tax=Saccharopolyspora montiporae TaxID=2781240 RepID=A0A929B9R8_9PSEU|nr:GNAT family N-acetyltransferase [Saccharopolyspora sp. HNM0983]MBE9373632.1 GNAT family N-acetyltransferase [Saccharopolyspora sp. HNM0983]
MANPQVRALDESSFRAANTLFLRTLHAPPPTDPQWERASQVHLPGRVLGGYLDGEELVGTARSMPVELSVPGGHLPAAAVTGIGVRADKTRQGLMTELLGRQFAGARAAGEPVAILHASEAVIYERFGYGLASRSRRIRLEPGRAAIRSDAPSGGSVEILDSAAGAELLPEVYRSFGLHRPGMISRSDAWWGLGLMPPPAGERVVLVHRDGSGVADGFAHYLPAKRDYRFDDAHVTLRIGDFQARTAAAAADLWRFLLETDLADTVVAANRPVDEPLEWWLTDRRRVHVESLDDDLWVRLVDVHSALNARTFGEGEPVVVAVSDAHIPDNRGCYRIGPDGAERTDAQPDLSLDVSTLGAIYLGDHPVSRMVDAGRVQVRDPAAVPRFGRLFAQEQLPWCGTGF